MKKKNALFQHFYKENVKTISFSQKKCIFADGIENDKKITIFI